MAYPVYVLLPAGVEWTDVQDTTTQKASPVRWYLRQWMAEAATQTAVLASSQRGNLDDVLARIAEQAEELGGVTIDCRTQMPLDLTSIVVQH